MLDALVAEARIRWGLDPAAGLQIAAPEGLAGTPVEASRPLLLVPLGILRAGSLADSVTMPLPGRNASPDGDALALIRRLYPADHPVGRIGVAETTTVGEMESAALSGAVYLGPLAPERALASPWSLPWIDRRAHV